LTIPTYSEIVGMHLEKPSIASGNQVCNQCFIWRKIIKNMLVIRKKTHYKNIFCVEYVAKFKMKLAIQNLPKKFPKHNIKM
jgi:hypothetical protein